MGRKSHKQHFLKKIAKPLFRHYDVIIITMAKQYVLHKNTLYYHRVWKFQTKILSQPAAECCDPAQPRTWMRQQICAESLPTVNIHHSRDCTRPCFPLWQAPLIANIFKFDRLLELVARLPVTGCESVRTGLTQCSSDSGG